MALPRVLDFARALAALLVLLFHIRSTLLAPLGALDGYNAATVGFYLLTSFGHDAVIVFFVLSGLLVGGAVLRLDFDSPHELRTYWLDRSVRIAPVLVAATVLAVTLQHAIPNAACHDAPATILGNAMGLQNFLVRPLCNNLPLWSISNEIVYYVAFPVIVAALSGVFSIRLALCSAGLALVFALALVRAPFDDTNIVLDFPFWLIGAALWLVPRGLGRQRSLALLLLAGALLLGRLEIGRQHWWFRDLALALSFAYTLATFFDAAMPREGTNAALANCLALPFRWFAEISFSLYVVHYPLIRLYGAAIGITHADARYTTISWRFLLEFAGLTAVCIVVAFGFSLLFERPRGLFKRAIADRLSPLAPMKSD
jgi:peptidoglycan/LPS O-acetylase OafA/YrhL